MGTNCAPTEEIRLSGYDTWFVVDDPVEPQHTLKIAVFDEQSSRTFELGRVCDGLGNAVTVLPQMSWRLQPVPFGLNRPLWVVDPDFRVHRHVRQAALPCPGTHAQLCQMISEVAAERIPPGGPPWELWFLTGLEGGKVVGVLKLSHALADGGTCAKLIDMLSNADPGWPPTPALVPRPGAPTTASKLIRTSVNELSNELKREVPRLLTVMRSSRADGPTSASRVAPPSVLRAPRLPWRGKLRKGRSFSYTSVPLADVKEVAHAIGGTVNDVVFAIVAGAVRRHLDDEGVLPDRPVVAMTVAKNRRDSDQRLWGNAVTTRFFGLPTHIADPLDRLRAAHAQTQSFKARIGHRRGAQLEEWIDVVPPVVMRPVNGLIRLVYRLSGGYIMVSNVPGPREKRYIGGMGIENFISSGHLKYAAGINVTVWSYDRLLNFSVYGCSSTLPDPESLARGLQVAFDELRTVTNTSVRHDESAHQAAERQHL